MFCIWQIFVYVDTSSMNCRKAATSKITPKMESASKFLLDPILRSYPAGLRLLLNEDTVFSRCSLRLMGTILQRFTYPAAVWEFRRLPFVLSPQMEIDLCIISGLAPQYFQLLTTKTIDLIKKS